MSETDLNQYKQDFTGILMQIQNARNKIFAQVNTALVELYFSIGKTISLKVKKQGWGENVVQRLADFIKTTEPQLKGFGGKNFWRMKQFYETYSENEILATLWREISWSNNRRIMTLKSQEERLFYLQLCKQNNYSVRELFKDSYVLEFLDIPIQYNEKDLQKALVKSLKQFIVELGAKFTFISEEYRLQVGNDDFYIDLLFFHRELQCLVAIELKTTKFKPGHIGQLEFYLEALDRDIKLPNENPSIGILLCKEKDDEVVKYALSRSISPTVISDYETKLIPKELLRQKLNEFYSLLNKNKEIH